MTSRPGRDIKGGGMRSRRIHITNAMGRIPFDVSVRGGAVRCFGPIFGKGLYRMDPTPTTPGATPSPPSSEYWHGSNASASHSGGGPSDGGASRHASRKCGPQRDEDLESSAESSSSESEGSASSAEQGDGWHSSGGRVRLL